MRKAIEIIETREGCGMLERKPRFIIMFRGQRYGDLYFNMTGYTGCYLPAPGSTPDTPAALQVSEMPISRFRKVISRLNREWAECDKQAARSDA